MCIFIYYDYYFLYLGKSHNLWHRSTLLLEKKAFDGSFETSTGFNTTSASSMEAMDSLSEMYSLLKEEDMWSGLWQRKAKYQETNIAIAYEQQGYFEQAQGAYELAMSKYRNDYNNGASPVALSQEIKLVSYLITYHLHTLEAICFTAKE